MFLISLPGTRSYSHYLHWLWSPVVSRANCNNQTLLHLLVSSFIIHCTICPLIGYEATVTFEKKQNHQISSLSSSR